MAPSTGVSRCASEPAAALTAPLEPDGTSRDHPNASGGARAARCPCSRRDGPRGAGRTSASCRQAAGAAWPRAPGRARVQSTSTAAGPGGGWSGLPLRAPGTAGATWRWSVATRRASSPPLVRRRHRRGAPRSWRAGRTLRARRSTGRSPRGHRVACRSDESAVLLQKAYTQKTTAGREMFIYDGSLVS